MLKPLIFGLFLMMGLGAGQAHARDFDHAPWDNLLKAYVASPDGVGQATRVDYAGIALHVPALDQYLNQLSSVHQADFDHWARPDQLAFLINAYNAWTIKLVLTGYPDIASIKDLGSWVQSPWKKSFIPLFGSMRSLDDIEHGLIRGSGRYNDPRVHFALNCASIGCPALRSEAYQGKSLDTQLESQTKLFLADRTRNHLEGGVLKVSPIFKWYHEDFESGWSGIHKLSDFIVRYSAAMGLTEGQVRRIQRGETPIDYLDYDWHLNAKGR